MAGGGFSKQFDQTDAQWQAAATARYLQSVDPPSLPPAGSYPPTGRGTPDVSALGEGYQVIVGGRVQSVGGTSASSPVFASIVSLINDARLKAGKKPMGLLVSVAAVHRGRLCTRMLLHARLQCAAGWIHSSPPPPCISARARVTQRCCGGAQNPFLYQNAAAFTDVTLGSNKVGRGGEKLEYGWNCSVGWDPATGLGTPIFPKLLAAAMAL